MATIDDLRDVIVQDINSVKRGHKRANAKEQQLNYDERVEWLNDKLTEILAPLILSQVDGEPLAAVKRKGLL